MSLLDCVCCSRHGLRIATCWDSPDETSPTFLTYSNLLERAKKVCDALRRVRRSSGDVTTGPSVDARLPPPIAIYGRSCPEIVCALLGVMSSGAPYMPLALGQSSVSRWGTLHRCGVHTLLIELSLFNVSIILCYIERRV